MAAPSIGQLRQYITIQSPTRTADGSGGWTEGWGNFANAFAAIKPVSARERFFADKLEHNVTHLIVIRFIAGLKANMRINFEGRYFLVRGFRYLDETQHWIEIQAEENVAS
jgi:SPP1 family predicted phage head-tail adaptor